MNGPINSNMQMVDSSLLGNDQPTWPAGEQALYETWFSTCQKYNRRTQLAWGMPEHVSTQYDAPAHVIGKVHLYMKYRWEKFIAPAVVWDIPLQTDGTDFSLRVKAQEKLPMKPGDYCIIVTGWHRLYSDSDRYFLWSPGLSKRSSFVHP